MKKPIWTYWHDWNEAPPYVQLCVRTMEKFHTVNKVSRDTIEEFLPYLREDLWKAEHSSGKVINTLAVQADYIKVALLNHYSGIYMDADTILVRPLDMIMAFLETYDFICYRDINRFVPVGFMACNGGTTVINEFAIRQDAALDRRRTIKSEFGSRTLTHIVNLFPNKVLELPASVVCPIQYFEAGKFMEEHFIGGRETLCYQLYNRSFSSLRNLTEEQVLSGTHLLSKLLNGCLSG